MTLGHYHYLNYSKFLVDSFNGYCKSDKSLKSLIFTILLWTPNEQDYKYEYVVSFLRPNTTRTLLIAPISTQSIA